MTSYNMTTGGSPTLQPEFNPWYSGKSMMKKFAALTSVIPEIQTYEHFNSFMTGKIRSTILMIDLSDSITGISLQELLNSDYMVDLKQGDIETSKLGYWKSEIQNRMVATLMLKLVEYTITTEDKMGILTDGYMINDEKMHLLVQDFNQNKRNLAEIDPYRAKEVMGYIKKQKLNKAAYKQIAFIKKYWLTKYYFDAIDEKDHNGTALKLHGLIKAKLVEGLKDYNAMQFLDFIQKYPFMLQLSCIFKQAAGKQFDATILARLRTSHLPVIMAADEAERKKSELVEKVVQAHAMVHAMEITMQQKQ